MNVPSPRGYYFDVSGILEAWKRPLGEQDQDRTYGPPFPASMFTGSSVDEQEPLHDQ